MAGLCRDTIIMIGACCAYKLGLSQNLMLENLMLTRDRREQFLQAQDWSPVVIDGTVLLRCLDPAVNTCR